MVLFRKWRLTPVLAFCGAVLAACGGSDEENVGPPGPDPDAIEEVSADAELDGDVSVEPDVEPDVVLGPTQAVGGTTSGGTFARSPRFASWSATTGGVLERRSARFVALGRVAIPFFGE